MSTTLAQVLRQFGAQYWREHELSATQAQAWRAIVRCRTEALGGQRLQCDACGTLQWRWHSCRNRHCPQCQSRARDAWRSARMSELLNVPYCHLVFTLPHELNALASVHPRWVYDTLMRSAAATLTEFAANPRWLGGTGAFTLVLHTWTQDLRRHIHVHALMACGALNGQGQWIGPARSERFLFPVHALSRVFRGKYLAALAQVQHREQLPRDPLDSTNAQRTRLRTLRSKAWVVYAKTPMAGPAAVLDYLSRYTHRTAIGNERLVAIRDGDILVRVRANDAGRKRVVRINAQQFIGRFVQHVLPPGYKRIRHYGLLSPARKRRALSVVREQLQMPQPARQATEDAGAFMKRVAQLEISLCTHCHLGTWRVREVITSGQSVERLRAKRNNKGPP